MTFEEHCEVREKEEKEQIKKYVCTIDGVDFSGKSTLWKKVSDKDNVQIRGILSNIAYGLKYNRDVDKMIEEYNKLPLNYVIYFLNPYRNDIIRNFASRLNELSTNTEKLIKEAKSFADTLQDYNYFTAAYKLLKEKYVGEIVFNEAHYNDLEDFSNTLNNYTLYTKDELKDLVKENKTDYIVMLKSIIDTFEHDAKIASEFVKIVFIDRLYKENIINELYDGLDSEHQNMLDFLTNECRISYDKIYDDFTYMNDGELLLGYFIEFLNNYEITIDADIRCELDTNISITCYLSELSSCEDIPEYLYSEKANEIVEELEYQVRDTEFEINNVEVR